MPALVTVFIINFLGVWNEYLLANFFISKDSLRTLPTGMVGIGCFLELVIEGNYAVCEMGSCDYNSVPVVCDCIHLILR